MSVFRHTKIFCNKESHKRNKYSSIEDNRLKAFNEMTNLYFLSILSIFYPFYNGVSYHNISDKRYSIYWSIIIKNLPTKNYYNYL